MARVDGSQGLSFVQVVPRVLYPHGSQIMFGQTNGCMVLNHSVWSGQTYRNRTLKQARFNWNGIRPAASSLCDLVSAFLPLSYGVIINVSSYRERPNGHPHILIPLRFGSIQPKTAQYSHAHETNSARPMESSSKGQLSGMLWCQKYIYLE